MDRWSEPCRDIDFSPVRSFVANGFHAVHGSRTSLELLARPATIARLDFTTASRADCKAQEAFVFDRGGDCHGLLGWFRMRLGECWLSTSPGSAGTHWSQGFLPFDQPLPAVPGETLDVKWVRPQFGDWSWVHSYRGKTGKGLTFLSRVASPELLRRQSLAHRTGLNPEGEMAWEILQLMDSGLTLGEIIARVSG